jgi:myo-inositol 2-dehydrogenase/D-chiro-inositol 1-dehydrogenase
VRLGIVGIGRIGSVHLELFSQMSDVSAVVVTDLDLPRARAGAERFGAELADGVESLLRADLDGVVVASTTGSHPELIERAVEAGLPVLCEKPIALDVASTLGVVEHTEARRGRVQIGFHRRFDAGYQRAREAVRSGRLGWLHTVRGVTFDPGPPSPQYVAQSGGYFRDSFIHDFDIIRWVTGLDVVEVYAAGVNRGESFFWEAGDVDTGAVILTLADSTLAQLAGTRYNTPGYDVRLELLGSRGNVAVGLDDRTPLDCVASESTWPAGPACLTFLDRFRGAYRSELRGFIDLVAGRIPSPCTVRDGLEALLVAEACDISRRDHRPVRLDEVRAMYATQRTGA